MARKYELLSEMYDKTTKTMTNPVVWRHFLESACRNYRLRFDEQLLVFAQRPDATAVLEIERWNKQFGRWVNRGANGIAVFEDAERNSQRLKYYFDISDTHESRLSRPVPIWNMREEYTEDVIDTLESTPLKAPSARWKTGRILKKRSSARQITLLRTMFPIMSVIYCLRWMIPCYTD